MYYRYAPKNSILVPPPFKRAITPLFMGDDDKITESDFSVHITEWEPGCEIDSHSHPDSMEAMYCMSGNGIVYIDGEEHAFVPGSMIVAPPNTAHRIINTGTELLRVFCVFSPPATAKGLRDRALAAVQAEQQNE